MNLTSTRLRPTREPSRHVKPFRSLIKRGRDDLHRWSLYDASGTVIGSSAAGFATEVETYRDAERFREELASAPVIGGSGLPIAAVRECSEVDGAAIGFDTAKEEVPR